MQVEEDDKEAVLALLSQTLDACGNIRISERTLTLNLWKKEPFNYLISIKYINIWQQREHELIIIEHTTAKHGKCNINILLRAKPCCLIYIY